MLKITKQQFTAEFKARSRTWSNARRDRRRRRRQVDDRDDADRGIGETHGLRPGLAADDGENVLPRLLPVFRRERATSEAADGWAGCSRDTCESPGQTVHPRDPIANIVTGVMMGRMDALRSAERTNRQQAPDAFNSPLARPSAIEPWNRKCPLRSGGTVHDPKPAQSVSTPDGPSWSAKRACYHPR